VFVVVSFQSGSQRWKLLVNLQSSFLRLHQGPHATFMCTNTLAQKFDWDRERLARARRTLIELGYLAPVRQAGRGHPALFRWSKY
jgi:hypothetical protein